MKRLILSLTALLAFAISQAQVSTPCYSIGLFGNFSTTSLTNKNVANDPTADVSNGYQPGGMIRVNYQFTEPFGIVFGTGVSRFSNTVKLKHFSGLTPKDEYPYTATGDAKIEQSMNFVDILLAFNSNIGNKDDLHFYVTPGITLSWIVTADQDTTGQITRTVNTPTGSVTQTMNYTTMDSKDMQMYDSFQAFAFLSGGIAYPIGPWALHAGLNFRYAITDLYADDVRSDYTKQDGSKTGYQASHIWSAGVELGVSYRIGN